jgi:hypothetical protein
MVPLKEAIAGGAWLHFGGRCKVELVDGGYEEIDLQFRLRVLSFQKIDLSEVDKPIEIDEGGNLWLLKIEAVNLIRTNLYPASLTENILLIDQDGFQFHVYTESSLILFSNYANKTGLSRFYGTPLVPKTKAIGAIAFFLPDDDEAEYSLAMVGGTVHEA